MDVVHIDMLVDRLAEASKAYYNTGKAIMSDDEFDKLKEELSLLVPDHPFVAQVGAGAADHLSKVELQMHMGSLNHAMKDDEFWTWWAKYDEPAVVITDKVDGCSVEVTYDGGVLAQVVSRGDGTIGNLITDNAKNWANLPKSIPNKSRIVVRGEAVLLKEDWAKNFAGEQNPRNSTTGTIMRKSGDRNEHIRFYAFDITALLEFNTWAFKFDAMRQLGFEVPAVYVASTRKYIENIRKEYIEGRSDLPYEIDGMVVAIADMKKWNELGFSDGGKRPRASMAWKFETEKVTTVVEAINLSQGHTGAIIPTAQLKTVRLAGTNVTNALLNNFDHIEELGVNIGDVVEVHKAGDIIPKILRVVEKKSEGAFPRPIECPICSSKLVTEGRYLKCIDDDCDGRAFQRVKNWVKKTGMKHIGDGLLQSLFGAGKVSCIRDLYNLVTNDLINLPVGNGILGEKNARRAISEIAMTRVMDTETFMGSLSIKFLGRRQAAHINLASPEAYISASESTLAAQDGMGPNKAREMRLSILKRAPEIRSLLESITIDFEEEEEEKTNATTNTENVVVNKSFVFSGKITVEDEWNERYTRARLQSLVRSKGGFTPSSMSRDVDYLVVADPTTNSSKARKARSYGIKIIGEYEFFQMVGIDI